MKIFISYAHVDEYRVRELVDILRDSGHDPWFDHQLVVGRKWEDQLLEAIKTCDRFLYALTPESAESKWCQWEFAQAVHAGKPVISVVMQAKTPLNGVLADIQYADFSRGPDARGTARLLRGVYEAQTLAPEDVPLLPPPHAQPERPVEKARSISALAAQIYEEAFAKYRAKAYIEAQDLLLDCLQVDEQHAEAQKLLELVGQKVEKLKPSPGGDSSGSKDTSKDTSENTSEDPGDLFLEMLEAMFASDDPDDFLEMLEAPFGSAQRMLNVSTILPPPFEWVGIPEGDVILEDASDPKRHDPPGTAGGRYSVPTTIIAQYPVTNAQYAKFVEAGGYREKKWWTEAGWHALGDGAWGVPRYWRDEKWNGADYPIVGVSWYEAVAFCNWLTARLNENAASSALTVKVTLPTEQEWQRAAQSDDGRWYPWGNEFDTVRCNSWVSGIKRTTPVTRYPSGASPYGVMDMSGNVWEWCLTEWDTDNTDVQGNARRVLRGGSWNNFQDSVRTVRRDGDLPGNRYFNLGFRLVCDLIFKGFPEF